MSYVSASERFSVQSQLIHAISAIEAELAVPPSEKEIEGYVTAACEVARGEARQRRIEEIVAEIRASTEPSGSAGEPNEAVSADERSE